MYLNFNYKLFLIFFLTSLAFIIKPIMEMPNLPVATSYWTPEPDFYTGIESWLIAGGAHHTAFSYDITAEQLGAWGEAMGIEVVYIDENTDIRSLKRDLMLGKAIYG